MSGLPVKPRHIWLRSFYGFSPEEDGYIGWTEESPRDRMLGRIDDGDLFMIYGASSAETDKSHRNRVLGFLQVEARAIHRGLAPQLRASGKSARLNGPPISARPLRPSNRLALRRSGPSQRRLTSKAFRQPAARASGRRCRCPECWLGCRSDRTATFAETYAKTLSRRGVKRPVGGTKS
jgi:hypothetical protein